jgi:hypothetical protein
MQAVGVNVRARYGQVDLDAKERTASAAAWALEHHMELHDSIAESPQSRSQLSRALFEGARTVDVMKGEIQG